MSKYNKIRTKYARNKLKQAGPKDKDYIDALIRIEEFAEGRVYGLYSGYEREALKSRFPAEWKAVNMEIRPKAFIQELEEERKEGERLGKAVKEIEREDRLEAQEQMRAWRKAVRERP
ncbi:MAG: hypothetical protein QME12_00135 [Nanoarchaeota archaeon]|nr:hypothetical protein [Nanoarchaeota archaeon]